MSANPYSERLNAAVEAAPRLSDVLWTLCRTCFGPGGIPARATIAENDPKLYPDLLRLFPPNSISEDRKRGKYVLSTAALSAAGVDLSEWLSAAAETADFHTDGKKPVDEFPRLVAALRFSFPALDAAVDQLEHSASAVRRMVTRLGPELALKFYKTALTAVEFLKNNDTALSPSELGSRITNDSKSFRSDGRLREVTAKLLAAELGCGQEEAFRVCGVTDNPTAIFLTVFGPFVYRSRGRIFDWIKRLWEVGEPAMVSYANLEEIEWIRLDPVTLLVSCENESPFNSLTREDLNRALIYTAGYPNTAVKRFVSLLSGDFEFLHWGDTDPEGLEIAAILNGIRPLELFRCDLATCARLKKRLRPLDGRKRSRAEKTLASKGDFPFRDELRLALRSGWLEQEAWIPE
jgi:hypothetical protein